MLGLQRVLLVLSVLGGAASCGSGKATVGTVPTTTPSPTNVSLGATTYDIGTNVNVFGLTTGADGNVWFSECPNPSGVGAVAKITTSAHLTEYPLPDGSVACPKWLTLGNDSAVWFTEQSLSASAASQSHIGRIDARGNVTEFPLPASDTEPDGIVVGGDGNIWYDATIASDASTIVVARGFSPILHSIVGSVTLAPSVTLSTQYNTLRVNPADGSLIVASGSVTRVEPGTLPRASQPFGIPATRSCSFTAPAKDGFLYFQCNASVLARASQTTYQTTYLPEPTSIALSSGLTAVSFVGPMAFGSDGILYVWGTLGTAPALFAMSTTAFIEAYYVDSNAQDRAVDVARGADGAMWFTVSNPQRSILIRVPLYGKSSSSLHFTDETLESLLE